MLWQAYLSSIRWRSELFSVVFRSRASAEMGRRTFLNPKTYLRTLGRPVLFRCHPKAREAKEASGVRPRRLPVPSTCLGFITALVSSLTLLMLEPPCSQAQFDMLVFERRPPQARSREELNAVLDIVQAEDRNQIVFLCAEFRKQFPGSEFLGQVYRMEMHAYGRLDDYQKTVEAGEKALEMNSHDVDALLTLANVIPNGVNDPTVESAALLDKAEGYGRRALEEISGLKATRGVPLDTWRKLTGRMKSSAHEALGFIAFKRGRYAESVAELEKSVSLNPEPGGSVFFRLGVAYLYEGKPLEAQVALERSSQLGPELIRAKAEEQLARLGKRNRPSKLK
jgi:hypothetical protein